jgi:hypothetical protein
MTLSRICRHRMLDKSCSSTSPLWKVSVSDLYIPGAWSLDRYLNLRPILIRAQFGATCGNFEIMWNMLFGTFIWYPQDQRCRKFTCFFGGDTREIPLFQPSFSTPGATQWSSRSGSPNQPWPDGAEAVVTSRRWCSNRDSILMFLEAKRKQKVIQLELK